MHLGSVLESSSDDMVHLKACILLKVVSSEKM